MYCCRVQALNVVVILETVQDILFQPYLWSSQAKHTIATYISKMVPIYRTNSKSEKCLEVNSFDSNGGDGDIYFVVFMVTVLQGFSQCLWCPER